MTSSSLLRSGLYLTVLFAVLAQGQTALFGDSPFDALSQATTIDTHCDDLVPSDTTSAILPQAVELGLLVQDHDRLLGPSRVSAQLAQDRRRVYDSPNMSLRKRKSRSRGDNDAQPTPEPTGQSSPSTTVHITDEHDFALLLPDRPRELIGDAESDGVAFCTSGSPDSSCTRRLSEGFIRAAAVSRGENGAYIQVTGCLDVSQSSLDPSDTGGQFDVRFPNGAQCTFGGYGASFIQLVEPAANRFCLRCCHTIDDQENCNSHHDRDGCQTAIPGAYSFPQLGVNCEN